MKKGTLMETEKQSVAVIHDNRNKGGNLGVVAFLEIELDGYLTHPSSSRTSSSSDILEQAFKMTNSIDTNWYENNGVTKMFDGEGCRSTMVGDFVLIGNEKWKCESTGWKEV